jgi:hypothetical protein
MSKVFRMSLAVAACVLLAGISLQAGEAGGCGGCGACAGCGKNAKGPSAEQPAPGSDAEKALAEAAQKAAAEAKARAEAEERVRAQILRLATAGWEDARAKLLAEGKAAVPVLIAVMNDPQTAQVSAFNLGGHTQAETIRAARTRPLTDACVEVLTELIRNRSTYAGDLPGYDPKAWQTWWEANGASVTFGG